MSLLCSWDRMMGELCFVFGKLHSALCNQVTVRCLLKGCLASVARSAIPVNNSYCLGAVVVLEIMFSEDNTEILNLI